MLFTTDVGSAKAPLANDHGLTLWGLAAIDEEMHIAFYAFCVDNRAHMNTDDVLSALFHETRQGLLATILPQPERWWYMTELANTLQKPPSSLQRELSSLVRAGILEQRSEGRKVYFRASIGSPVYADLRRLFENIVVPNSSQGSIHAR